MGKLRPLFSPEIEATKIISESEENLNINPGCLDI